MQWKEQNAFTSGVWSPRMFGRTDLKGYAGALAYLNNFRVLPHGGVTSRSGLRHGWAVKDSTKTIRLIPFVFNSDTAYVLEAGPAYFRFGKNGALLMDGVSPVELVTPYLEAELNDLRFVQSADVLWIVHPKHAPRRLERLSETSWRLTPVVFVDGPYGLLNARNFDLYASAATGSVTVTCELPNPVTDTALDAGGRPVITCAAHGLLVGDLVAISNVLGSVDVNGSWTVAAPLGTGMTADTFALAEGAGLGGVYISGGDVRPRIFKATDVGRHLRIYESAGAAWGWGDITAVATEYQVTVSVVGGSFPVLGTRTNKWRLGKYSDTTGWPGLAMLYEQRMVHAGATDFRQIVDLSQTDLTAFFGISEPLVDSDACSFSLYSQQANAVKWLAPCRGGLAIGTAGGEWIMKGGAGQDSPITPNSISVKQHTTIGCSAVTPVTAENAILYVGRSGKSLHEFAYLYQDDTFRSPDLSVLAEHLTKDYGMSRLAYQSSEKTVWAVRADGALLALTYMRTEEIVAWHLHTTRGRIEDVICVPGTSRDVPYVLVKRRINGAWLKTVEFLEQDFRTDTLDAFFVDAGSSVDSPKAITNIAVVAGVVTVTAGTHGFSDGDLVDIVDVLAFDDGIVPMAVNGQRYTVANKTADTFELDGVDGTDFAPYLEGGQARKAVTSVSGATHLEGEAITVLADGKVITGKTVTSGGFTLSTPASRIHYGLAYVPELETLPIELATEKETSIGRVKTLGKAVLKLSDSYGAWIGRDFETMDEMKFNENTVFGAAPTLFSGEKEVPGLDGAHATDVRVCVKQTLPLPLTINALIVDVSVTES